MSIQSLSNTRTYAEDRRSAAAHPKLSGGSFQERLAQTSAGTVIAGPTVHLRMPGENTVYSGARGGLNNTMQEIYAEYTADSTAEEPIVRITGMSDSGYYDITCRLNEVDPSNASYAELAALYGHLVKTGVYQSALPSASQGVLPTGVDPCDVTVKKDWIREIQRFQADLNVFGPDKEAHVSELLALYQPRAFETGTVRNAASLDHGAFMESDLRSILNAARLLLLERTKEGREWKEEQEEWDRLMKCLDRWIEALRDRSERKRKDGGVTAEGGEAMLGLCQGYIAGAAWARAADDPAQAREDLLSALTETQSRLLERLKEDKADEEDREVWADLLRRLDRWIERLRAERREEEKRASYKASAVGVQTDAGAER